MRELLSREMAPAIHALGRPGTLIVLDFDGTLAPIVGDRDAAGLPKRARAVLERLADLYPVAVLSGRAAHDVRARLGEAAVRWVVGSHGAEWPGEERAHRTWRARVTRWHRSLASSLARVDGVELEVKPLSLAVHYRRSLDPRRASERIHQAIEALSGAVVVPGKKVVNVLPAEAGDKGTALRRLATVARARRVLFVGDDVTDEAAFAAKLAVPALMVRVGRDPHTRAGAWLRRRADVDVLLERLCQLRGGERDGGASAASAQARPLGSVLEFMQELWALEQGLNRRSKAMLGRYGVTGPQRLVVRVVGRLGPISPARLATVLHIHRSSVTRLVRRLEARNFIRRAPDPTHGGRYLLEMGSRGERVEELGGGTVEGVIKAALASAAAADVKATRRVIALLTRRLVAVR